MKKVYILYIAAVFSPISAIYKSIAQTGPGGVGSSSTNNIWYKADALAETNGDTVGVWTDMSGNGNNATQSTAVSKPTFLTSQINSLPVIDFDGTNDFLSTSAISALNTNTLSWLVVASADNNTHTGVLIRNNYGAPTNDNNYWGTHLTSSGNAFKTHSTNSSGTKKVVTLGWQAGYNILTTTWNGSTVSGYFNGTLQTSSACSNSAPSGHAYARIGANSNATPPSDQFIDGKIAEIIVYTTVLNNAQRIIVGNYLAAKYNLSYSADKFAYESTHSFEVAGIGREDASNIHNDAQGTGIVRMNTPSNLSNGGYLLWGHNNGSTTASSTENPSEYGTLSKRLPREWRADLTGTVGTVTITFDLTGITFGDDNGYELLLDADGDFTSGATRYTTGVDFNTITKILTFTLVDFTGDLFFTVGNTGCSSAGTVTSVADGSWNVGATWDCGVPPSTGSDVLIDGETVTLTSGSVSDDVTISSGILNGSTGNLSMTGNLSVTGTFNGNTSTITMSGSSSKTISGAGTKNFNNLTVNKSGTATVTASTAVNILGTVDVSDGQLITGGNVTLKSNSSGTASVGNLSDGSPDSPPISGDVVAERFINEQNPGWYMLASPLTDADFEDWNQEFYMSGFTGTDNPCCFHSVVSWNEASETFNDPASTATIITNGGDESGYFCYIGDDSTSATPFPSNLPKTLTLTGTLKTGSFTISGLTNTDIDVSGMNQGGWHLLGNPYAAPIDWTAILANGGTSNINSTAMRLLNTGSYDPVEADGVRFIASGEAFWIYTPGFPSPDGTIQFQENDKLTNDADTSDTYNQKLIKPDLSFGIKLIQGNYEDVPARIIFSNEENNLSVTTGYDPLIDAAKKPNSLGMENIATVVNNDNFCLNYIPDSVSQITIPIRVWKATPSNTVKTYTLEFNNVAALFDNNKCVVFEDVVAGISFPLTTDTSYTLSMSDTTNVPRFFVHISSPLTVTSVENSCYGYSDGLITAAGNGNGPFTYVWTNQAGDTLRNTTSIAADTLSNLTAGIYHLSVYGNGTCGTINSHFEIEEPAQFTATVSSQPVGCFGGNDGIALATPDSSGVFNYVWTNSGGDTVKISNNITGADSLTNVPAGEYTVSILKNSGCISTVNTTVQINSPSDISVSSYANQPACFGMAEGSAFVNVSGGTEPYAYLWSTGATTSDVADLPAADYFVTITDSKSCQKTTQITISEPSEIAITEDKIEPSCYGFSDGSISVTASGGSSEYSFQWSNGNTTTSLNNLAAGTLSVTVSDFNACEKNFPINISQPDELLAALSQTPDSGSSSGTATATISGGTAPYTYLWNDNNNQTTDVATGLAAGTYSVLVKDANNCEFTDTITVTSTVGIQPAFQKKQVLIYPNPVKDIFTVEIKNSDTDFSVSIINMLGQELINQTSNNHSSKLVFDTKNLSAGVYQLRINEGTNSSVLKLVKTE